MPESQVKSLLAVASQLSGYPIPTDAPLPVVEELTTPEMAKVACDGDAVSLVLGCGVIGMFDTDHPDAVLVDAQAGSDPGSPQDTNTIAIHELTHWLQFHNHFRPETCPDRFLIEYQAFATALAYQIVYENKPIPDGFVVSSPTYCPIKPLEHK